MTRRRADELLVSQGLCPSRSQARHLILGGKVFLSDGSSVDKPGRLLPVDTPLRLAETPRYVGRGGEKLAAFLSHFPLEIKGLHALDVGASTGGFTDCLLQHGVASVTCVDVGQGQLHPKLLADPRVTNLEKINARHLQDTPLPHEHYPLIVADLSFISLRQVLDSIWSRLAADGILIVLVKPQFELGREIMDQNKGIVRDPVLQEKALTELESFALSTLKGAEKIGNIPSPIAGGDGNREFLLGLRKSTAG